MSPRPPRHLVTDPAVIRDALQRCRTQSHAATAREVGVAVSTLTSWRRWQSAAAARGEQWPSDFDITAWHARAARRQRAYTTRVRWIQRTSAVGPMRIPVLGTRRRLQALAALGWRYSDIADRMGVAKCRIGHLAVGVNPTVHRDTAAAVAAVYEQLSMTVGPSQYNRTLAAGRGWAPPLAWDDDRIDDPAGRPRRSGGRALTKGKAFDEIAIERAMAGDRVHLTPTERTEAVRRLTDRGLSLSQAAERLGTTKRSVSRHRAVAA